MWLRRYPTMQNLSQIFAIPVTSVHRIIHRMLPMMHVVIVPEYIRWHSDAHWRSLAGYFPYFPRVVGIIDGTPFRISRPRGILQRLFWRKDRHCFFLNWLVVVDVEGFIVWSIPGFVGHLHDSTCYRHVAIPNLPANLQIMADQGFANRRPFLLPVGVRGQQVRGIIKEHFKNCRTSIERCFGILKSSYCCVGTRRFRSSRFIGPLICNVTAAMCNRRKMMFQIMRQNLNLH